MIPSQLIKRYKRIYISVSGYVDISNLAINIIDTFEFQRLRYLHQLGTAYFAFPSATHSRFEHSIGVYDLADNILNTIKETTSKDNLKKYLENIPELQDYYHLKQDNEYLDDWVCELVKIAALTHDIGHGPFSHLYDDYLELNFKKNTHEQRSLDILDNILPNILNKNEIEFIKSIIEPSNRTGFIYEIVANKKNSIDVDKLDYINRDSYSIGLKNSLDIAPFIDDIRVIDNTICYPIKQAYHITNIFNSRYSLHKQICSHKTVISSQLMIYDILTQISDYLINYNFNDLTDDFILTLPKFAKDIDKKIINKLNSKNFYKCVNQEFFTTRASMDFYFDKCKEKYKDNKNIRLYKGIISMVPDEIDNPFENIYFYKRNNTEEKILLDKIEISRLLPSIFKEYYVYVFET